MTHMVSGKSRLLIGPDSGNSPLASSCLSLCLGQLAAICKSLRKGEFQKLVNFIKYYNLLDILVSKCLR